MSDPSRPARRLSNLTDLSLDPRNANRGTRRGAALLADSLTTYGAGRSVVADRNGVIIAGNKTVAQAQARALPIHVVETTGDALVVVQRTDLDLLADDRARQLALADNRIGELNLAWDPAVMETVVAGGPAARRSVDGDGAGAAPGPPAVSRVGATTMPLSRSGRPRSHGATCWSWVRTGCYAATREGGGCRPRGRRHPAGDPDHRPALRGGLRPRMARPGRPSRPPRRRARSATMIGWTGAPPWRISREPSPTSGTPACTPARSPKRSSRAGLQSERKSSGRSRTSCSAAGTFTGSTSPATTPCATAPDRSGAAAARSRPSGPCRIRTRSPAGRTRRIRGRATARRSRSRCMSERCSARLPGELLVDLFAGSGTALIAAQKTGRRCGAIELDPAYVQMAVDRWEAYTGQSAVRHETAATP